MTLNTSLLSSTFKNLTYNLSLTLVNNSYNLSLTLVNNSCNLSLLLIDKNVPNESICSNYPILYFPYSRSTNGWNELHRFQFLPLQLYLDRNVWNGRRLGWTRFEYVYPKSMGKISTWYSRVSLSLALSKLGQILIIDSGNFFGSCWGCVMAPGPIINCYCGDDTGAWPLASLPLS